MTQEHVTLREFIERILQEREKLYTARIRGEREALRLARTNIEAELLKLNALRTEVTTDRGTFVSRERYDADFRGLNAKIDTGFTEIRKWQDRADGAITAARFISASGVVAIGIEIARVVGWIK